MKISIAMATYNGSRFLTKQLESIISQIRLPDEMVISDDASTDETSYIIERFKQQAPFVVIFERNKENLGSTKNFEKCLQLCTGDIISLADQDDIWCQHKLQLIEDAFVQDDKIGLAFSDSQLIDENGSRLGETLWERTGFTLAKQIALRTNAFGLLLRGPIVTGMSMAFKAKYLCHILPFPENWHHDAWTALMISVRAKLEPIAEALNAYRVHTAQQTYVQFMGEISKVAAPERARRFQEAASRYEKAAQHIGSWEECESHQLAIKKLKAKARNKRIRSAAYSRRFFWHLVILELIRGGYHRYASGERGAIGDLFRLANPRPQDY